MDGPRELDLVAALARRVRSALADAARIVARSELIVAARALVEEPRGLAERCAWCGRVALDGRWMPERELPAFLAGTLRERATHGICPDCVERLEREGKSRSPG